MKLSTKINIYFSHFIWSPLPEIIQKILSQLFSVFYKTKFSILLIKPFCLRYLIHFNELAKYQSESGSMKYSSFQDFFTRKLLVPIPKGKFEIWPCQGAVCDFGIIKNLDSTKIKGENKIVPIIFGSSSKEIPENYFFINIFLHNYNYHRFHSPINGTVKKIEYIKGKLNFLRPWLYSRKHISEPAFKNERYILVLEDDQTRSWFLTFVGGMGVGKIKLNPLVLIGNKINIGDEIGVFLLGSTCCMAIPTEINGLHYLKKVDAGQNLF